MFRAWADGWVDIHVCGRIYGAQSLLQGNSRHPPQGNAHHLSKWFERYAAKFDHKLQGPISVNY